MHTHQIEPFFAVILKG